MIRLEQKVADFAKDVGTFFVGTTEEISRRASANDRLSPYIDLLLAEAVVFSGALANRFVFHSEGISFLGYLAFDNPYAAPFAVDGGVRLLRAALPLVPIIRFGRDSLPAGAIGTVREIVQYAAQLGRRYIHRES